MVLMRSPIDPLHKSVFRSCYRVFLERNGSDAFQVGDSIAERTEQFVMNAYGRKTKSLLQNVQDILLDEVERAALTTRQDVLEI